MEDIISGVSKIDNAFQMYIVYSAYDQYDQLKPLFDQHGYAFLPTDGNKTFYVDGEALEELTTDQFYAIQAHEIAHFVLKHTGHYTEEQEKEADVAGVAILNKLGFKGAAKALEDRAIAAYGAENLSLKSKQLELLKQYLTTK